jgi:5-methylcytosine-specific restriction endonuclease McrA
MPNQFTGPKYRYPEDDEFVELFRQHGYMATVAKAIGIPRGSIRGYLNRRPALKQRCAEVSWGRAGLNTKEKYVYPPDAEFLEMVREHRTVGKVAVALGIPNSALCDYVRSNPDLKSAIDEIKANDWHNEERQKSTRRRNTKEWVKKHPEKMREYNRKRRREKREEVNEAMRRWYERNKMRPSVLRNRSRRNNLQRTGRYTDEETLDYIKLIKRDPCSYCGGFSERMAVDHIEPVSRGGDHHWTNMTIACQSCNSAKRDRPMLEFLLYTAARED